MSTHSEAGKLTCGDLGYKRTRNPFPSCSTTQPNAMAQGIKPYYQAKIEECELIINEKSQDLRRLEAQRNALNAKGA